MDNTGPQPDQPATPPTSFEPTGAGRPPAQRSPDEQWRPPQPGGPAQPGSDHWIAGDQWGSPQPGQPQPGQPQPGQAGLPGEAGQPWPAAQPGGPGQPGQPWGAWQAPPGGAAKKRSKGVLIVVSIVVVAVLGCLGTAVFGAVRLGKNLGAAQDRADAKAKSPFVPTFPGEPLSPSLPGEDGAVQGPQASSYPVREDDDLRRVCQGWFYPQSAKVAPGLNPAFAFTNDRDSFDMFVHTSIYDIPYGLPKSVQAAYDPAATKVRVVACLTKTSTGKTVRTCKFNDPKPDKATLKQANYQFTLYEVATGRKLVDKKISGEDDACPYVAFVGADKLIYSTVGDRQLYELLRPYVQKK